MKIEMKITFEITDFFRGMLANQINDYELSLGTISLIRIQDKPYLIVFKNPKKFDRIITKINKIERKDFRMYNEMGKM